MLNFFDRAWTLLADDKNLAIIKLLGTGFAGVVAATWAVVKFFKKTHTTNHTISNISDSSGVAIGNTVSQGGNQAVAGQDATINISSNFRNNE